MITTTNAKEKEFLEKLIAPVEWIWNPGKNTYGRVLFTIGATMLFEFIFFGDISWMINLIFLVIRMAMSFGGYGGHLIFILLKAFILAGRFYSCGYFCVLLDITTGYCLNMIYFKYAGLLKSPDSK